MTAADLVIIADALHGARGDALAVADGRIAAVGDAAEVSAWSGVGTRTLRVPGTVLPGLVDAHAHPVFAARVSRGLDLRRVRTLDQLREALAAERRRAPGEWILGWGLEHAAWEGRAPEVASLAEASGDAPMLLRMFDAHSALASRAALERAGVHHGRTFESGSCVEADADDVPTGFLREHEAIDLVERIVPAETAGAVTQRLATGLAEMAAAGLTGVHVMDFEGDPGPLYETLDSSDRLPLRLRIHPWVDPSSTHAEWDDIIHATGTGGRLWRRHGVKLFLDGTVDNGTAWLREPDCHGESVRSTWHSPAHYAAAIERFAAAGVPTATHAIGDAAVRHAAASIAAARAAHPGSLHRIEHLELTGDDIVQEVAASGAVVSMQPTHCTRFIHADGSDNWSERIGAQRAAHAWRTRSLADLGVTVALGSDWPVAPFDPREVLAEARTRSHDGGSPIVASEGLSPAQALAGYTSAAAVAAGTSGHEGRIGAGMRADLTILSVDPGSSTPDAVMGATVLATIVDGVVRHRGD